MEKTKILIIGGDTRAYYMAMELSRFGYDVSSYGVPRIKKQCGEPFFAYESYSEAMIHEADIIVLPIPVTKDRKTIKWETNEDVVLLSELYEAMQGGQILFGGQLSSDMRVRCKEKGVHCYDFMELPLVTIKNAIATAEGAIAEAIMEGEDNLHQSNCIVIGYGQCGRVLADKLKGLQAKVTIMARRTESREEAQAMGYQAIPMFHEAPIDCSKISYIFNTVPALVLPFGVLQHFPESVVIIDIASAPGGCDYEYCRNRNMKAKLCLGLPGKYAPKTSGEILANAIAVTIGNENGMKTYNNLSS